MSGPDVRAKALIVRLILSKETERALEELSSANHIDVPRLKVGAVKGMKKALAVYVEKERTIYVSNGEILWNPFVILHEFYHHLRCRSGKHRGTEKLADAYAMDYIKAYRALTMVGV
ncbi:MAG TPA: hypothetical protein VMS77_10575 [Conexivisphaerales archaeon]|nr:hypothetical protein [Conexivisphaerales archaeon]